MRHYMIGDRPMTQAERNARRKAMLKANPFLAELDRKARAKYRREHAEEIAAQRRARRSTPEFREAERIRQRAIRAKMTPEQKEARRRYYLAYRLKHAKRIRENERAWLKSEHGSAVKRAQYERNAARMRSDPAYAEHCREMARAAYARRKATPHGMQKFYEHTLVPWWRKVVSGGQERIAAYMKRARPENRRLFVAWYASNGLIDRKSGLGHIETETDGTVGE